LDREHGWCGQGIFNEIRQSDESVQNELYFRFALQVLRPVPLNANELIFTQFISVPVFTGLNLFLFDFAA
jgi:hypothetical protein